MPHNSSKNNADFITELYNKHYYSVMKVIRLNCFSKLPQDHEDILQEVFLKAVSCIATLKDHSKPSNWLYKTALYLTFNFNRKLMDQPDISEEDFLDIQANTKSDDNPPDHFTEQKNEEDDPDDKLDKLLKLLSDEEKHLYILRYEYNFSYKDIAAVLHISENNVGVRIHRLSHRIKKLKNE